MTDIPNITPNQLKRIFPHATASVIKENRGDTSARQPSEPQHNLRHAQDGSGAEEEKDARRFLVRFTDVRRRLLDEDNLVPKFLCDCLRYSGIIHSDAPSFTHIETRQRKPAKGEQPHTLIEVFLVQPQTETT